MGRSDGKKVRQVSNIYLQSNDNLYVTGTSAGVVQLAAKTSPSIGLTTTGNAKSSRERDGRQRGGESKILIVI